MKVFKNYLVTGGAGFIGSHLVDRLVKLKKNVKVIDNLSTGQLSNLKFSKGKIKFYKTDVSKDKNKLIRIFKNVDCVIHLAALADLVPSITHPEKYFSSNVLGTFNVLQAAKINSVKKLIYAGSASCYGLPKKFPTSEKEKIDTQYPYATSKYLGEKLVLDWAKVYKMNNISLRFFNVYGPRSRTTGAYGAVFGVFLAQKLSNIPLTIVGDGKQTRDFIHVYDLSNAFAKAIKSKSVNKIYNLGSGKRISINLIAKIFGGKKKFIPIRPGEPKNSLANISKVKKEINWKPKISIEEGIRKLLRG